MVQPSLLPTCIQFFYANLCITAADDALFRREGDGQWEEIRTGLPEPKGALAAVVARHTAEPGVFYAAINSAVYRSDEAGRSWQSLPIDWPAEFTSSRIHAMAVASE